jgi:hypothetical protein
MTTARLDIPTALTTQGVLCVVLWIVLIAGVFA